MAVTKKQLAQWSKNFEAKYPEKKSSTGTAARQVSDAQMNQWEQGFQAAQADREKARAAAGSTGTTAGSSAHSYPSSVTSGDSFPRGGSLGTQVLAQMMGVADSPNLPLAVPEKQSTQAYPGKRGIVSGQSAAQLRGGTQQPEWLTAKSAAAPAAKAVGTVQPTEKERIAGIANGEEGFWGAMAQTAKEFFAEQNEKPNAFRELNEWMDADPKHRELVSLMRTGKSGMEAAATLGSSTGDRAVKSQSYSNGELLKMGYTAKEISEAQKYITEYDAIPNAKKDLNRVWNFGTNWLEGPIGWIISKGENAPQAVKNSAATQKNRDALKQETAGDERQSRLFKLVDAVDSNGSPKYSDADLQAKGYTQDEIDDMRRRYADTEVSDGVDPEKSLGYQISKQAQRHGQAALSGLAPMEQKALGIVGSAAQNLTIAALMGPEGVLPMLSGSGAADAMVQSMERGDSAGKTLLNGGLKFGAGWAINSVGAADLAKTMGSDYAKDTLAGKLADIVRSVAADGALAQQYPAIANAISGGMDNAMQAFVETYADKAIDAALGDSEAAADLLKSDTFFTALESGLTGGASGALGGAVGTGLAKFNSGNASWAGQAQQADYESRAEKAQADTRQAQEQQAADVTEQTAVNDDPAVHTPAQNASIAEYKDSADPDMKAYVDKVRAGEELPPYMVTETSDRMRSAMMELTGMQRVGDRTLLDANGVKHITNRHGGGDGSADGTMKESADVARAAYVLNNFDNAYLATRKADGYFDSRGKRAPIVIFEKKIDGSHIIVEAVCDTKRGRNFIVSEYLSSVGVPEKEIAKALQSPMGAAESDARDTSETLATETSAIPMAEALQSPVNAASDPEVHVRNVVADPSAGDSRGSGTKFAETGDKSLSETPLKFADGTAMQRTGSSPDGTPATNVTQRAGEVNEKVVEKAGENVRSSGLRETYGLAQQSLTAKQRQVQQELTRWKVSDGASETISKNMPTDMPDTGRYAAAASSLYRLGQMEDVKTFDKAMELARGANSLAVNTEYVLAQPGGEQALRAAWLQGQGELEAGNVKNSTLGGNLTEKSTSGTGRVLYRGTMRTANEVGSQLIELNARATNTDAVMKAVLQGSDRVKAYVDTETARIFFSDRAEDVFGTILHEDYHWYNSLDAEGANTLQQHALEYLAKMDGYEGIDELIRSKLSDYAQQGLTYNEAAEELVADAWRGVFGDEKSFARWVEFQRGQAEKNAGKAGTIHKVMTKVKELLSDIISKAKEVLAKDPENKAALRAQRLAEAEKRALQDEYFAHADKAIENLRAAKENAAALENKGAAKGARFEIKKDAVGETYIQIDEDILKGIPQENWKSVVKQAIKERFPDGFVRNGWTILNSKDGRNEFVWSKYSKALQWENATAYADKMRMAANLDEIIATADEVYREPANHKNAEAFNRGKIKIRVGENAYEADVLTAIKPDTREIFYDIVNIKETKIKPSGGTHVESEDSRSRLPESFSQQESADTVLKTEEDGKRPDFPAGTSIAQENAENKGNDGALKKNIRLQLSETDELIKLRDEQRQLDEQRRALKEERSAWLESDAVKEIEARKKALGIFSAEAKAYRNSEEYQNYLAKRKDYNARMAQLDDQSAALDDRMKEAKARLQQRQDAIAKDKQLTYNAKAEAYGGKAEYRRALAKEQFGTTEDFKRAGYILPDGQMLNFAQNDRTRDTDHREIMSVFGPAEVRNGTEALNEFLLDGNVRVMAEAPGIDLSADTAPTAQQLEQIRRMAQELGGARRQFTLDISTADGRVAASKEYSGRVDADRVVREIRDYYKTGELAQESSLARFRFQLAEQASRDAKKNDQQTASHTIADKAAALDTLSQFFGLTRGVKVSQTAIEEMTNRWAKANGSKVDRARLARETKVLVEYLKADGADMEKAEALAETLAGEVLDGATYRSSELWDEYPELHKLEYTVNKNGSAKEELVKAYGSWSAAVAEARKHGVTLRQAEGVRDGNPAEQYESVVNDTRAMGGVSDGAKALWKAAAQQAGVEGAGNMESTEWLNVLMNLHDAIKPTTQSRFADDSEYEDARMELAGRMIGDILSTPEMTDAQAIFEGIQRHNLQVAQAAAGSEERAAEVAKGLRSVQKTQQREFNRRLYENRRAANQSAEVQQMNELQRQNAKAEKLLDENLETLGVDITNVGDLNEKLTFLRESYEREMKQEVKRLKAERQEMLDEAKLWYQERMGELREENTDLSMRLREEQRRADKAEYSLIVQENEIMEWEADNERKRAAWEQKQAQRNALAIETARQQRDEDIAIAKAVAEKRVQKARDARKMDELKRGIRQNAAQLNQMLLRPGKDKFVQPGLIDAAAQVAKLADMTILNNRAVNQLTRLQDSIRQSAGSESSPNAMTEEWKQTGVDNLISALRDSMNATKEAKLTRLHEQLAEAEALPDSEKARALVERLQKRIKETENRTYLPMTVEQMQMLKAITSSTLHVIRNANKTVSLAKAEEVSKIAEGAAGEVRDSKGNHPGGKLDGVHSLLTKYQLDMLGAQRVFRMLGGYTKNGQMEKLANMLNDGQYRQTKITVEGEKLFADVTGKEHVKEMKAFAGPGADLVDVGLTDTKGSRAPLTHAQLCSLYMHLHNKDSLNHLMTGGLTIPDAKLYSKGDIEQAYQKGQTVQLGMMTNADGTPSADSILQTVEGAMNDYDRAWCADMKEFFDHYTTKLINETSLQLVGYQRATVKNYYPIAVDKTKLATQIEGLNLDATIEGRGFLKNRVKSSQPILLEECSSVVQRSLRDTAAYAGLAAPIRDVQKVLNSSVETRDGLENLKNGILKEQWGKDAVDYINDLLTDLQTTQRKRPSTANKVLGRLRGNYAGAVLTLNPGVAIAQAASLPTAAAVLGGDTMAAVVPFVKNLSPKARAALETEIAEHGDVLLALRKRGSQSGELASIGRQETLAEKGMDKLPGWMTGWINGMDEVTVAALWEGSKRYVQNHTTEFEGADVTGSPAYWEAVNRTYQRVIEQTQPNYTVMQRAGIQRNPNEMLKQLTMFTTQRFQNYGILADAIGDWRAQAQRYQQNQSEENRAELQRAKAQRNRAIVSQAAQTAVFAIMKIGADFLLHRWDREQDENGDVTAKSLWKRFRSLYMESFAGNFLYGSELYGLIDNAAQGKDYDVASAASISVVNDLASGFLKLTAELKKDTSEMTEEQLQQHHEKVRQRTVNFIEDCFEVAGVPYGNGRKLVEAVQGYMGDLENLANGGEFSFNSLPQSATGQYDRLYNAYRNGDAAEAQAAAEKLDAMTEAGAIKENQMYSQLKNRLVKYDPDAQAAAQAQLKGDEEKRYRLEKQMIEQLYDVLGIGRGKADAPQREAVIDTVTGAVNALTDAQLKGDNASVTADLVTAVDSWDAGEVQKEYDRLTKAGKNPTSLKSKITETAKPEYLAGSAADREKISSMLLALEDADGKALYTEKNFAQWVKNAEKEEPEFDPYAGLR